MAVRSRPVARPDAVEPAGAYPVGRRSWGPAPFGPGMVLGGLGAAGVIVSMFLSWWNPNIDPSKIPAEFLWHRSALSSDPSLLIFLVPIAVVIVLGAFMPLGAPLRFLGGVAMLAVAAIFAYQLHRAVRGTRVSLGDALDTGFYIGAIGGVLAVLSSLMPAWIGRRGAVASDAGVEPVA